jgi:hypothetical protein
MSSVKRPLGEDDTAPRKHITVDERAAQQPSEQPSQPPYDRVSRLTHPVLKEGYVDPTSRFSDLSECLLFHELERYCLSRIDLQSLEPRSIQTYKSCAMPDDSRTFEWTKESRQTKSGVASGTFVDMADYVGPHVSRAFVLDGIVTRAMYCLGSFPSLPKFFPDGRVLFLSLNSVVKCEVYRTHKYFRYVFRDIHKMDSIFRNVEFRLQHRRVFGIDGTSTGDIVLAIDDGFGRISVLVYTGDTMITIECILAQTALSPALFAVLDGNRFLCGDRNGIYVYGFDGKFIEQLPGDHGNDVYSLCVNTRLGEIVVVAWGGWRKDPIRIIVYDMQLNFVRRLLIASEFFLSLTNLMTEIEFQTRISAALDSHSNVAIMFHLLNPGDARSKAMIFKCSADGNSVCCFDAPSYLAGVTVGFSGIAIDNDGGIVLTTHEGGRFDILY